MVDYLVPQKEYSNVEGVESLHKLWGNKGKSLFNGG